MSHLQWTGQNQVVQNLALYGQKARQAVIAVANYYQAGLEAYARENAPWTDASGNARQSLHAYVVELANETVELYLSHGVSYGLFLEVRWSGKYAIIWPTIQAHLEEIRQMLQEIFS